MSNNEAWLNLAICPGLGRATAAQLLGKLGSAEALTGASRAELIRLNVTPDVADQLLHPDEQRLQLAADWLAGPNRHLLTPESAAYPHLLIETGDAPLCLFVEGDPDSLSLPQLAIVGSRNATPAGLEIAQEFAAHLARGGITVTSGLALGIDTAAHTGALRAEGTTIAVTGCGPEQIYPRQNAELAGRIAEQGAVITEFPPGTPVRRDQFPRRNRIIAGLALGTLVVEAGIRSGSLITARLAGQYGREIFAIPGSIHSPLSKGCHQLIRQGAKLAETARDVIEELGALVGTLTEQRSDVAVQAESPAAIDPDYAKLLAAMDFAPVSVNRLAERTGLTTEELSSMLLILELEGRVSSLPGGLFQQIRGVESTE